MRRRGRGGGGGGMRAFTHYECRVGAESTIGWLHAVVLAKAAVTVQTKPMNALKVSFTWALVEVGAEANEVSIVS